MKNYIAILVGVLILTLTACKDDGSELKASLEVRKYDMELDQVGDYDGAVGEISSTFQEKEPLLFVINLKNEGVKTEELTAYSCSWARVEVYDDTNRLVFNTEQLPLGCSADIDNYVLYSGEKITRKYIWEQELYEYVEDTYGEYSSPTGEYLSPGEYTAVTTISIGYGPMGSDKRFTTESQEQTLVIEPATTE